MKTATLDVGGMLSMLDYLCVQKQLGRMPGVHRASASIASGSVTVEYDETVISIAKLKDKINEYGFHCTGQILPKHVCKPRHGHAHFHGVDPDRPTATAQSVPPVPVDHERHAAHHPAAASTRPMSHDMAHEMGHGAGTDMAEMVRDMRNRFWISLIFTVPIFALSPMGMDFVPLKPPFGLDLNVVLFFLASGAILYPAWPFVVAAVRALRNGVSTWRCWSC
jgi:Cu2+-exporting ATPase